MHKTLSENQSKYLSESECNIVHEYLSQNNYADVPENDIMELKDDEYKEPSVTGKVTIYFNIFECSRNLLDKLEVTYQQAFMVLPVQEEYYIPSPARERYYNQLSKILINSNVGNDGTINNDKLNSAITYLKSEAETGHERNINDMMQVDEYKSPGENKYAPTINDSAYHNLGEYKDEISDSSKQFDASKEPITDNHVRNTSVGIVSAKPAAVGVGIIGQGGRDITQGMINGGTGIIESNVVTDVLTDSSKMIFKTNTFPLNTFKSYTLVIPSQNEPMLSCDKIVRASSDIGNSKIDHGRIGTPIVNKNIWSVDDNFSV